MKTPQEMFKMAAQKLALATRSLKLRTSPEETLNIAIQKLEECDAEGARQAFDEVWKAKASDDCKSLAFLGLATVKAVTSSDVIRVPGIHFEYLIMEKVFCPVCKVRTHNYRRSMETKYLSNIIIDSWYAECPKCKKTRQILLGVPPNE